MAGAGFAGKRVIAGIGMAGAIMPGVARAAAFDVDHAAARYLALLSPEARARSDAYFDGQQWLGVVSSLITVVLCWLVLRSGLLVRLRDAMRRQGWRPWVIMVAVSATFLACLLVLELPWSIYVDYWRERRFGLMNLGFGGWLSEQAIAALITLLVGPLVLTVINAVMRGFPRLWWLVGAGAVGVMIALFSLVAPVFILPLFNSSHDLAPGPLRDRIVAMANAQHIPADHIDVFDASRQSDRISAHVAGLGPTVRISLTDNLVNRTGPAETVAVVGHEMGHYVLHHVWRMIGFMTLLAGLQFWLITRLAPMAIALGGRRHGVRGLDDPAALPVLVGLFSAISLLFLPVTNTYVRSAENDADVFGLDLAREPDGFARAAMQVATFRKLAPPAWEEALFYDHPSGRTRVTRAMQWKKDHVPGATEVQPAPLPAAPPSAP